MTPKTRKHLVGAIRQSSDENRRGQAEGAAQGIGPPYTRIAGCDAHQQAGEHACGAAKREAACGTSAENRMLARRGSSYGAVVLAFSRCVLRGLRDITPAWRDGALGDAPTAWVSSDTSTTR